MNASPASIGKVGFTRWLTVLSLGLLALAAGGRFPATVAHANAHGTSFEASFEGTFDPSEDIAQSPLFVVAEEGAGTEADLGDFTYTASVPQNLARLPAGCGSFSSTGVAGVATLVFDEAELSLKRIAGTACFAFPSIVVSEKWAIASGTGVFAGATGTLTRELEGDVRTGIAQGTFSGTIAVR